MRYSMANGLYLINDAAYLHIQEGAGHFDYTLYDKETMRETYLGRIDASMVWEQPAKGILPAARSAVFKDAGINAIHVKSVPLNMLRKLKDAQLVPPLDEYPRPDPLLTMSDIACTGYLNGDLLPVSDEIAADLSRQGFAIYEVDAYGKAKPLAEANIPGTKLCGSVFAISREAWEASPMFRGAVADRMNHQVERELTFRCHLGDCFAIYQLNHHDPEMRYIRYESLESLQSEGQRPQKGNYELVYTSPLPEGTGLNVLWEKFNIDHPPDYRHPSMSISDVVAIKKDGTLTCYYVDQYGYAVLDDFFEQQPRQANRATLLRKPSIKAQLAAKPVPGDQPTTKPKDREVR